jgi:hypothetical protein
MSTPIPPDDLTQRPPRSMRQRLEALSSCPAFSIKAVPSSSRKTASTTTIRPPTSILSGFSALI